MCVCLCIYAIRPPFIRTLRLSVGQLGNSDHASGLCSHCPTACDVSIYLRRYYNNGFLNNVSIYLRLRLSISVYLSPSLLYACHSFISCHFISFHFIHSCQKQLLTKTSNNGACVHTSKKLQHSRHTPSNKGNARTPLLGANRGNILLPIRHPRFWCASPGQTSQAIRLGHLCS